MLKILNISRSSRKGISQGGSRIMNCKMLKILIFIYVLFLIICANSNAFDEEDTHPRLSQAAIDDSNLINYLINNLTIQGPTWGRCF